MEAEPLAIQSPYLMFLGDAPDQLAAKTADGVKHWRPDWCKAQFRLPGCNADLGLPDMTIAEAAAAGIKTVILGVANRGGVIGEAWMQELVAALENGMDIASGLHTRLADSDELVAAAEANGTRTRGTGESLENLPTLRDKGGSVRSAVRKAGRTFSRRFHKPAATGSIRTYYALISW